MPSRALRGFAATLLFVSVAAAVRADDKGSKKNAPVSEEQIVAREKTLHSQMATDLAALANDYAKSNLYADVASLLDVGLAVDPGSEALKKEKSKHEADEKAKAEKKVKALTSNKKGLDAKRETVLQKWATNLVGFALECDKAGLDARFQLVLESVGASFPAQLEKALQDPKAKAPRAVWFTPYIRWFSAADAKKLEAGGELYEGKWLDAKAVAELDKKHVSWSDPWIVADDVHELRTTVTLREGRTILARTAAYREFFLKKFQGSWDLKPPKGKLPMYVTRTQKDYHDLMVKNGHANASERSDAAACYMHSTGTLDPIYVTFEPRDESGQYHEVKIDYLLSVLQHELTHQIATEYSKHACDPTRLGDFNYFCVEGIAELMLYEELDRTGWHLTKPKKGSAFAWCKENLHQPENMEGFFNLSHQFFRADYYQLAATASYFLLEGENGKYRTGFLKLLETVHQARDTKDTLHECFPGVDFEKMHDEYKKFVKELKLDEEPTAPAERSN